MYGLYPVSTESQYIFCCDIYVQYLLDDLNMVNLGLFLAQFPMCLDSRLSTVFWLSLTHAFVLCSSLCRQSNVLGSYCTFSVLYCGGKTRLHLAWLNFLSTYFYTFKRFSNVSTNQHLLTLDGSGVPIFLPVLGVVYWQIPRLTIYTPFFNNRF